MEKEIFESLAYAVIRAEEAAYCKPGIHNLLGGSQYINDFIGADAAEVYPP